MPRPLNEPGGELPQSLTHRSSMPLCLPERSPQNRLLPPSYIETMFSSRRYGTIHSFLPHTPEPYGHVLRRMRSSKRLIQAAAERSFRAATSWTTSSDSPHFGQR